MWIILQPMPDNKQLTYETFEVSVRRYDDQYLVHVLQSPNGETRETVAQELVDALAAVVDELADQREEMANSTRRTVQLQGLAFFKKVGTQLFDTLFSGEVRSCYDVSLNLVQRANSGLRIRLRIEPPELAVLPWELMFDRRSGSFLSLSKLTPIVRYIEMKQGQRPVVVQHPLRVLVILASPEELEPLDLDAEVARMQTALKGSIEAGLIEVDFLRNVEMPALIKYLREHEVHVLHYAGHGHFDAKYGEGFLLLEDANHHMVKVSGEKLGSLLRDVPSLRLVVLNACSTAADSESNPFSGVAMALVQAAIPSVVAMQMVISDQAALNFAQAFYESIATGFPVDAAVSEGRKAVDLVGMDMGAPEWSIPMLFSRMPTGDLFKFEGESPAPAAPPPAPIAGNPVASNPTPLIARERPTSAVPPKQTQLPAVQPSQPVPRAQAPADVLSRLMAKIPAAQVPSGNGQMIPVAAFEIDVWPITHADYLRYVNATGSVVPASWAQGYPSILADHPVTGVSWHEAAAYAAWVGKRLPTAAEWRLAAGCTDGRKYPWGNDADPRRCNSLEARQGRSTPVQLYQAGVSPFGVMDMAGNVWEWVIDEVLARGIGKKTNKRMLKGGSWDTPMSSAECHAFISLFPEERQLNIGFRCVR